MFYIQDVGQNIFTLQYYIWKSWSLLVKNIFEKEAQDTRRKFVSEKYKKRQIKDTK